MLIADQKCSECGAPLHSSTGLGLCNTCLLREAIALPQASGAAATDFEGGAPKNSGDYELLDEIGRGGMGVVYRARQRSLGRIVALKVLLGGTFAGGEGRRRLKAEAAAAARLQHPNIVAVHEIGELDAQPFYSMEFIDGRTLADVIRDGPMSAAQAANYLLKITRGVQYAHEQGILHRDLKPSNVLLDVRDEPCIADFGLARQLHAEASGTLTGTVMGSPAYMPPEQAAGRNRELSAASDVYALGAMLYEMLTGRPPFQGASPQAVMEQVKTVEPVAPRRLNASVPADLETVTLKCLEKKPAQRYATAQELAEELGRFLGGEPVNARPVSAPEKTWRWARRRPLVASLAGISLILLLAFAVLAAASSHRVRVSRDQAQLRLAESLLSESHALRLAGEPGWRETSLGHLAEAHRLDSNAHLTFQLRREAIAALARPDLTRHVVTNLPPLNNLMNACFDETFERVAIWNHQTAAVEIRRVVDGALLATCAADEPDEIHAFNADGKFLLLRHGGEMSVWNTATGAMVVSRQGSESHRKYDGGEFSPDGKKFGRGETNGQFVIYDLTANPPVRSVQWPLPSGLACATVAWSADGKSLVLILGDRTLAVCTADSGGVRWQQSYHEMIWNVTWNNARDWLVLQSGDDRVLILRPEDGGEIDHLNLTANGTPIARLSPNGNFLAVSGTRFGTQIFDAATRRKLAADPAPAWHLQFDAAGMRLGSQLDQGRPLWLQWQPPLAQRTWRSPGQLDENEALAFSGDGRWLATLTGGGLVVWEMASGKIITEVTLNKTRAVAFDPPGHQLFCLTDKALFSVALPPRPGQAFSAPRHLLDGGKLTGLEGVADGRIAVGDMAASLVHLLGAGSQKEIHLPIQPLRVAISPDGHWLACGAYLDDNLYISDTTQPGHPAVKLENAGNYGVFSPDGEKLFTFGHRIRVWRVGDWRSLPDLPDESSDAELVLGTISPDGRWLAATEGDREVHLIELVTGKLMAVLDGPGEGGILALAFSPDGKTLVIARDRGDIQIWPLHTLKTELAKLGLDW
jgi:WD40 repeat protein